MVFRMCVREDDQKLYQHGNIIIKREQRRKQLLLPVRASPWPRVLGSSGLRPFLPGRGPFFSCVSCRAFARPPFLGGGLSSRATRAVRFAPPPFLLVVSSRASRAVRFALPSFLGPFWRLMTRAVFLVNTSTRTRAFTKS